MTASTVPIPRRAASQDQAIASVAVWSYALMILAWMFDFRSSGEGEGLAVQSIFAAIYIFGFLLFLIVDRGRAMVVQGLGLFVTVTALFLVVALGSGQAHGQTLYQLFRNGLSVLVYLSGAYATVRIVASAPAATIRRILAWACLGYAVSAYFSTLYRQGGIDTLRVRYQIIGESVVPALGYIALLVRFRLARVELLTTVVNLGIVFLSVTRTYLIVALFQLLPALRHPLRLLGPRTLALAALLAVGGLIALYTGQAGIARWTYRLFEQNTSTGQDVTYLSRLSEWEFMWSSFLSSMQSFLFGNGLAARTVFYMPLDVGGGADSSVGFGHNQYLSILFIAGAVGGLPLIAVQFVQAWRALGFLSTALGMGRINSDRIFLGAWGSTIVLGALAANYLSSDFYTRGASLWFGIGTGLLLGVQAWFDPRNLAAPRRPGARRPNTPLQSA